MKDLGIRVVEVTILSRLMRTVAPLTVALLTSTTVVTIFEVMNSFALVGAGGGGGGGGGAGGGAGLVVETTLEVLGGTGGTLVLFSVVFATVPADPGVGFVFCADAGVAAGGGGGGG